MINPTTRLNIWAERIVRDVPPPVVKQGEFDSPVGTAAERAGEELWPGQWIDANSYGNRYTDSAGNAALHPGADLNLNSPTWDSDKGAPVYACADGTVRYAALRGFAWSNIVIVEHAFVASRYAHLATMAVIAGQAVKRGDLLGTIGHPGGGPNHLHFDISPTKILIANPGDWPGLDAARLHRDYVDPLTFIRANRPKKGN